MAKDRLKDLSELLSAYLDDELEESARAEVVAYLDRDAGAVRLLNELRETRSMLQDLPHQSAPTGFSESVVSAVERQALLGGEPDTEARMSTRRRWGPIRSAASIALLVGAAGTWIFWQSDRWKSTELARSRTMTVESSLGRTAGDSAKLEDGLARADGVAAEPIYREESPIRFKNGPLSKAAAPHRPSADSLGRVESAEMEHAKQQQQSIVGLDLKMQADDLDDEVVMLEAKLDTSWAFDDAAGTEQVDFGLAGQSREARLGGAAQPNFSQLLQANEPAGALAFYAFSNESNVLTLSFANDAQRDEFTQDVDAYLADNDFLSAADPRERVLVVEPLTQNVVLRGHQGLNYSEPRSAQMLLNASPKVLEGLIDRYAETTGGLEDTAKIELQMGEMRVEGLEEARRTIRELADLKEQRPGVGEGSQTANRADDTAADADGRLTASQWRAHFTQLRVPAKAEAGQAAFAKQGGAEKDGELAQDEDESDKVAGAVEGPQDGRAVSSDPLPARPSAGQEIRETKKEVRREEQAVAAGEKNQNEASVQKKKHRARSAKGRRAGEIELFGGGDETPPTSEQADEDTRGRGAGSGGGGREGGGGSGGGGGVALNQLKRPGPSRPIRRAPNLTFVLKLQTVPPATPKPTPEPIPEMGPPSPSPESDDSEE